MPSIDDIILKKKEENEFFNTYQSSTLIGEKIFKSFVKLFNPEKGFPLSVKDPRYGTISNAMALSTILELEDMGVDISSFRKGFRFVLKHVFDSVYKNGINSYPEFDATPYFENTDTSLDTYVETASKILIIMIDLRMYANRQDVREVPFGKPIVLAGKTISSFSELVAIAEKLLLDTTRFLNDAVLLVREDKVQSRNIENTLIDRAQLPSEVRYRGWAFCHPQGESDSYATSIYYTYHATNAYVSLYNAYPEIFSELVGTDVAPDKVSFSLSTLNEEQKELHRRNLEFVCENRNLFNEFRIRTASSGRYIEMLLNDKGVDIAFDFVRSDFSGISSSRVIDTQENNAVINTLFILAIYLNAGVDEDYEHISAMYGSINKNKDWFYNQLQFALSNIRKIYSVLKVDRRQELIDSFRLNISLMSEKYPSRYNSLVQQLRNGCKNVAVYDLIPLLCNTYSIVFDYLIKYPQLEMVENLDLIMENCSDSNEWLWGDADGFNINNHLYYVVALENFYRYYENYEEKLSGNNKEYNRIVKKREEEFEKKLSEERLKTDSFEEQVSRLERELKEKRSGLDKEVEALAQNLFESLFEQKMISCLENMLNDATVFYIDALSSKATSAQLITKFRDNAALRVALALYGSPDFSKVANARTDLASMDKNSDGYAARLENQINEAIADSIDEN